MVLMSMYGVDKFKEENWNLEVSLQELRQTYSALQQAHSKLSSDFSHLQRTHQSTVSALESTQNSLTATQKRCNEATVKWEADMALARKEKAGLLREKSDLHQSLETAKVEIEKTKKRLGAGGGGLFLDGSPTTPGSQSGDRGFLTPADASRIVDDTISVPGTSVSRRCGPGGGSRFMEDDNDFGLPTVPTRGERLDLGLSPAVSGLPSDADDKTLRYSFGASPDTPVEALKAKLALAQQQITTLKAALIRDRAKSRLKTPPFARRASSRPDGSDGEANREAEEDAEGSVKKKSSEDGLRNITLSRRRPRASARGGRGGRGGLGMSLTERLLAAQEKGDDSDSELSVLHHDPVDDDEIQAFDERSLAMEEAELGREPSKEYDAAGMELDQNTSVEGMDPAFANILRQSTTAPATATKLPASSALASSIKLSDFGSPVPLRQGVLGRSTRGGRRSGIAPNGTRERPDSFVGVPEDLGSVLGAVREQEHRQMNDMATQTVDEDKEDVPPAKEPVAETRTDPLLLSVGSGYARTNKANITPSNSASIAAFELASEQDISLTPPASALPPGGRPTDDDFELVDEADTALDTDAETDEGETDYHDAQSDVASFAVGPDPSAVSPTSSIPTSTFARPARDRQRRAPPSAFKGILNKVYSKAPSMYGTSTEDFHSLATMSESEDDHAPGAAPGGGQSFSVFAPKRAGMPVASGTTSVTDGGMGVGERLEAEDVTKIGEGELTSAATDRVYILASQLAALQAEQERERNRVFKEMGIQPEPIPEPEPRVVIQEVIKEVPVEIIKEVPVEKVVEVVREVERMVEVVREVPVETVIEVVREVPVEVIKEIVKEIPAVPVEVIKEIIKEVPVEVIKEVSVEKVVEVVREVPVEKLVEVVQEVPIEKIVEVVRQVPVEVIKEIIKEIPAAPVEVIREIIKEVPVEVIKEVSVEKVVEVIREVPVERLVEVVKEVPFEKIVEVVREVPVEVIKEIIKEIPAVPVEVIKEIIKEVPVEVTKEVSVEKVVEVIREVPVEKLVEVVKEVPYEKIVEVIREVPVEVIKEIIKEIPAIPVEIIKEIIKEVPVEVIKEVSVEKVIEAIREVPVEKIVEVVKEVPVEKIVEVVREVPVEVIKEIIKEIPAAPVEVFKEIIKEVPVEVIKEVSVEKVVEVVREVPVEKIVEVVKEVPVERIVEVVRTVPVEVIKEIIKEVPIAFPPSQHTPRASAPTAKMKARSIEVLTDLPSPSSSGGSTTPKTAPSSPTFARVSDRRSGFTFVSVSPTQSVATSSTRREGVVDSVRLGVSREASISSTTRRSRTATSDREVNTSIEGTFAEAAAGSSTLRAPSAAPNQTKFLIGTSPTTNLSHPPGALLTPNFMPARRVVSMQNPGRGHAPGRPLSPPPADLIQRAITPQPPSVAIFPNQESLYGSYVPRRTTTSGDLSQLNSVGSLSIPGRREHSHSSLPTDRSSRSSMSSDQSPYAIRAQAQLNAVSAIANDPKLANLTASQFKHTLARHSSHSTSQQSNSQYQYPSHTLTTSGQPTDPSVIYAITQTMIGEFLWKYTRRTIGKAVGDKRHKRFFWVHPYTRTLYWSESDPGGVGMSEGNAKSSKSSFACVDVLPPCLVAP
jgi:Mg/Co/Ni transporter MgtE